MSPDTTLSSSLSSTASKSYDSIHQNVSINDTTIIPTIAASGYKTNESARNSTPGTISSVNEESSSQSDQDSTSSPAHKKETYSTFIGYCFSINFILGVGILGVPNAFQKGGIAFSVTFLFFVSVISFICVMWLLEAIARAESMQQKKDLEEYEKLDAERVENENQDQDEREVDKYHQNSTAPAGGNSQSPLTPDMDKLFAITSDTPQKSCHSIQERSYEISEMMGTFLGGRIGKAIWDVLLYFYMSTALVSYCSVFGSAFASKISLPLGFADGHDRWYNCDIYKDKSWDCQFCYSSWVLVFGCMVIGLSMLNLTEQKLMQVSLTFFRYLCVTLMLGSAVYAMFFDPYSTHPEELDVSARKVPYIAANLQDWKQWFNFQNFYVVFPTAIYSQLIHHSIPGLQDPVPLKHKRRLPVMFGLVFVTTFIGYSVLGIIMVLYYGSEVESSISLNFSFFRGGASFEDSIPFWVYPLSWTIILFPAVDCVSVFPLCIVTLSNNLSASLLGGTRWAKYRVVSMAFRLCTALPPLLIGLFVSDLSLILNYVGIIGIAIAYNIPAILQIASMRKTKKEFGFHQTVYSYKIISNYVLPLAIFLFGCLAMVMIFAFNIWEQLHGDTKEEL
mmetsp:Transcript_10599/g.39490  ORF Transcript_10599/g.39490 Transcript_10599/m.39490 type:complete len:619 (-) Transcript_10599:903-2759(-)